MACVNHLDPARLDREVALAVARSIVPSVEKVIPVEDGGFVAYEWIGMRNYLSERTHTRGANTTSLDALMAVETNDGTCLLLIEWKYTESYRRSESRAFSAKGTDRVAIYRSLLERADCPIAVPANKLDAIFYDPIEQLMRQTLLGWQMVEAGEFGATDWRHVSVIPEGNRALLDSNPSPDLPGGSLEETWRSVLKEPDRYRTASPTHLLGHVPATGRWADWRRWLETRYGTVFPRSV